MARPPFFGNLLLLRVATASVWAVLGLGFKVFGLVPRHAAIVAVFFGEGLAMPLTKGIGFAETAMALWTCPATAPRPARPRRPWPSPA